ncbi:hypothetical protein [Sphingosinicella terrae]|uniref:hypothetical protein n=1 Tax=Sphingosinicella terrae TaxID=2172047 RepID=UPI000E0D7087|nr:hypothetical protein [Sphingosinicella terrae]
MTLAGAFLSLLTTVAPAGLAAPPAADASGEAPVQLALAAQEEPTAAETPATEVQPEPPRNERGEPPVEPREEELIDGRRRPDIERELPDAVEQFNPGAIRSPPPEAFPADHIPIPDRWRLIQSLGLVTERWWDPYNQNTLKGDRPLCIPTPEEQERRRASGQRPCGTPRWLGLEGDDWFFVASAVSDTVFEPRSFPIPVGVQSTQNPDSNDVFGRNNSIVAAQTFLFGVALIKGSTAYKPPDVEWRVTLAAQANYVDVPERRILDVRPSVGSNRFDYALGVQEAFVDYHLTNTSYRYDFYSLRLGIQPFNLDFRGFLFQDQQLGFRLFGNRDNNRFQFNFAAIWRLEKDTNSGLNNLFQRPRDDWILHANLYRQDFPIINMTSEVSVTWNINREADEIEVDDNGFPVRPALIGDLQARNYDAWYFGYNADGHIGRLNLSASFYGVFGSDRDNIFTGEEARIAGYFAAVEPSVDFDWVRVRGAVLFASGDGDPYDDVQRGFDAIFENPIFAGADTSYWVRQGIPFIGGGRAVNINGRNGILADLRSSKEQGQSNFVNPGTMLLGVGADFDISPRLRVSTNVNHLWFHQTEVLEALRMQGTIRRDIGWDLSAAIIYRPEAIQNVVFRLSGALLQPGTGFQDLFENETRDDRYYSILLNAILTY